MGNTKDFMLLLKIASQVEGAKMTEEVLCKKCKTKKPLDVFDVKNNGKRKVYCRECCIQFSKDAKRGIAEAKKLDSEGKTYQSRNKNLTRMGFESYKEYLNSPLWREIRKRVYLIKGDKCFLCEGQATELHHNRYHQNDLSGKKIRNINPVCLTCHLDLEFKNGKKTELERAKRVFRKRRNQLKRSKRNLTNA